MLSEAANPQSLPQQRLAWKSFLIGTACVPIAYVLLYLLLRITGVFYAYYSQGSWEIEGGTRFYYVDIWFVPLVMIETDVQNYLRWLPEPTGG